MAYDGVVGHKTEGKGQSNKVVVRDATGVSVQHERDGENFSIEFLEENNVVGIIELDVATARMLKKALGPMKILDENGEKR